MIISPDGQFKAPEQALIFRLGHNLFGSGIMVSIREYISFKLISSNETFNPLRSCMLNLNLVRKFCTYKPYRNNTWNHLEILRGSLDLYSAQCEKYFYYGRC